MKKSVLGLLFLMACAKQQVHPPVGGVLSEKDLSVSRQRAKNLNEIERAQIQEWMTTQNTPYYPMGLNYWTDLKGLKDRERLPDGSPVSYTYEIFDFEMTKLSDSPIARTKAVLGKFEDLKAVDDAVRYLRAGETATLLVPSVLAYGTYGDNNKISNDMPLIIKLKMLQ